MPTKKEINEEAKKMFAPAPEAGVPNLIKFLQQRRSKPIEEPKKHNFLREF